MLDLLIGRAASFAHQRHAGQTRTGSDTPYIIHPAGVAATLHACYPEHPELAAAGWLHDTLEDTATDFDELSAAFGSRVAALVDAVTKRRGVRWSLDTADRDVVRLKAADVLDNVLATRRDLDSVGPGVWERFSGGRERKLRYYRGLADQISATLGDEPLAVELGAAVASLD